MTSSTAGHSLVARASGPLARSWLWHKCLFSRSSYDLPTLPEENVVPPWGRDVDPRATFMAAVAKRAQGLSWDTVWEVHAALRRGEFPTCEEMDGSRGFLSLHQVQPSLCCTPVRNLNCSACLLRSHICMLRTDAPLVHLLRSLTCILHACAQPNLHCAPLCTI